MIPCVMESGQASFWNLTPVTETVVIYCSDVWTMEYLQIHFHIKSTEMFISFLD